MYDHIYESYHFLSSKFPKGLNFIIAGDTIELDLEPIISLNQKFVQVVKKPTRIDPVSGKKSLLNPIITTLAAYYQEPECLDPLDVDNKRNVKKIRSPDSPHGAN